MLDDTYTNVYRELLLSVNANLLRLSQEWELIQLKSGLGRGSFQRRILPIGKDPFKEDPSSHRDTSREILDMLA